MNVLPLISCLCVTRKRVDRLKRAVSCFLSQTYVNKELLVIVEDDDVETVAYLQTLNHSNIRYQVLKREPKMTLGELRNLAIDKSQGEYFCQWDDDDWYHCERLARQVAAAIDNYHPGSILTNWLIFDESNKQAYFSWIRWWEGSILFKKDVLITKKISYPAIEKGEDTFFIQSIINKSRVYPMISPPIYIYTYHGKNTWDRSQFETNFKMSQKLSIKTSLLINEILEGHYTNEQSSALLFAPELQEEINFFHYFKTSAASVQPPIHRPAV